MALTSRASGAGSANETERDDETPRERLDRICPSSPWWAVEHPARPYKRAIETHLLWETLRLWKRPGRARTVEKSERAPPRARSRY
jgi:hypothetical protein